MKDVEIKEDLKEKAHNYYHQLSGEAENSNGFPEFAQFCEEFLHDLIQTMTIKQLKTFINKMKEATYLGFKD